MVSRVKSYFLEIKDFSNTIDLNLPENYKIVLDNKDNFHLNKFFYKQIGLDHFWRDRLLWSDSEWVKYVTCLLYTSPSPRDGLLSRMPSSA